MKYHYKKFAYASNGWLLPNADRFYKLLSRSKLFPNLKYVFLTILDILMTTTRKLK